MASWSTRNAFWDGGQEEKESTRRIPCDGMAVILMGRRSRRPDNTSNVEAEENGRKYRKFRNCEDGETLGYQGPTRVEQQG
jgi:hypothetical protein